MDDNARTLRDNHVCDARSQTSHLPSSQGHATRPAMKPAPKLGQAIVSGLSTLIEGQRRFADEFGLSLSRVFPKSYELLEGRPVDAVVREVFRAGDCGQEKLQCLFDDLFMHQIALVGSLEDVARQTMRELSPETIRTEISKRWVTDGGMWKAYKNKLRDFEDNEYMRYERLIASGFVPAYVKAREDL